MAVMMRRMTLVEEQLAVSEERDAKLRRDLVNITTSAVEEQSAGGITPGTAGAVGGKRPRHVGSKGAETDIKAETSIMLRLRHFCSLLQNDAAASPMSAAAMVAVNGCIVSKRPFVQAILEAAAQDEVLSKPDGDN